MFLSTNVVNAGNLFFNMVFSRLMGPELFGDLAVLMTIKLALLGTLGAFQMAVSHGIAGRNMATGVAAEQALSRTNRACFLALWLLLPLAGALLWSGSVGARLGLSVPVSLTIILLSLPFTAPLAILRGVALGRLDIRATVLSANAEMLTRLLGGLAAWGAGLGIAGVSAAIAASVVAGWLPVRRALPPAQPGAQLPGYTRQLATSALPFAALQAAVFVMLDGDIILAKLWLGSTAAGLVAVLVLFQRLQFFACSGLAALLLPQIADAEARGAGLRHAVRPAAVLAALVAVVVLGSVILFPEVMVRLLVGSHFLPAAAYLWLAVLSAVAFTASYLFATMLAGLGDRRGIRLIVAAVPLQLIAIAVAVRQPGFDLWQLYWIKAVIQVALFFVIAVLASPYVGGRRGRRAALQ